MVEFGINGWCWAYPFHDEKQFTLAISSAKRIGYDGIETPVEDQNKLKVSKLKGCLTKYDMRATGITAPTPDLLSSDRRIRDEAKGIFKRNIEIANELDEEYLVTVPSKVGKVTPELSSEEEKTIIMETLRELGDHAEENGIYLVIEPLNRFETYLVNTVDQALTLVKDVAHPNVKIMIDTFHMNIEENSFEDAIRAGGESIYHVHANENNRGAPGTGHIPFKEILRTLKDIGYRRWLVIQTFNPAKKSEVLKAGHYPRLTWRALAVDQDTLAREGLRHLKQTWSEV